MNSFSSFKGKKVLITGHTGFKGSWLAAWMDILQAEVVGIGLEPPTKPSHFNTANLTDKIQHIILDIRDKKSLEEAIQNIQPDYVFHLAAQSLVRKSYEDPLETWNTNLNGTLNVLETLRKLKKNCSAILITSDKCYDNVEWVWGYRENDRLGGEDPYSASKGAAELAIRSYVKSFFPKENSLVRIGSARAGNVIGGGDWADNRIIPDCIKAWSEEKIVDLRSPNATRPWQHVLEPLSGYINQALALENRPELHGESFNYGPVNNLNKSVLELVNQMAKSWDKVKWQDVSKIEVGPHESGLLKLNCDKALHFFSWHGVMDFEETVAMTVDWYRNYYNNPSEAEAKTIDQINEYVRIARNKGLIWAN